MSNVRNRLIELSHGMVGLGGRQRVERTIVKGFLGLRILQLAPTIGVFTLNGTGAYTNGAAAVAAFVAVAAW